MLKPRTPEELLAFCRRKLGLRFLTDPSPDCTDVTDGAGNRPSSRNILILDHAARARGSGGLGGSITGGSGGGGSGGGSSNSCSSGSLVITKK